MHSVIPRSLVVKTAKNKVAWQCDLQVNRREIGEYTSGTVAYGTTIVAPATPTKSGYTFNGWSPAVDATMPAANTTYTATWTSLLTTIELLDIENNDYYCVLGTIVLMTECL